MFLELFLLIVVVVLVILETVLYTRIMRYGMSRAARGEDAMWLYILASAVYTLIMFMNLVILNSLAAPISVPPTNWQSVDCATCTITNVHTATPLSDLLTASHPITNPITGHPLSDPLTPRAGHARDADADAQRVMVDFGFGKLTEHIERTF